MKAWQRVCFFFLIKKGKKEARLVESQLWLKQKTAACLRMAQSEKGGVSTFLQTKKKQNTKTEKVSIVFAISEDGSDSKDTWNGLSAVISQRGNSSILSDHHIEVQQTSAHWSPVITSALVQEKKPNKDQHPEAYHLNCVLFCCSMQRAF